MSKSPQNLFEKVEFENSILKRTKKSLIFETPHLNKIQPKITTFVQRKSKEDDISSQLWVNMSTTSPNKRKADDISKFIPGSDSEHIPGMEDGPEKLLKSETDSKGPKKSYKNK